ncbi:MAG: tryptophan synthase subunit alpha [Micavibrio aeruginosavorus]|uniref:Tryptophan synthase alpha chain n=1 Tax=Micavibrio aeruginosavorus TaxID=349221 RepID=A0A2W5Q1K2_9BACT|nr:MAG: tryptophan synthase subunit alpha [Micavibrio aeruginosavorus]
MTNRIDQTFAALKAEGRKALASYYMAGDPEPQTSLAVLEELAKSVDILEIGMPFTDPMADGPVIQAAGLRALKAGMTLKGVMKIVQRFRSKNNGTPIVLMGYLNPIMAYGYEKFINDCKSIGIDGLIIADLPPEEDEEIVQKAQQNNIHLIRLVAPTTNEARLPEILKTAGGFLYYVSIAGITGTASADPVKVGTHIAAIKKQTNLPVLAGFGIKTPEDASAMAAISDGVIVGSALIQPVAENPADPALPGKIGAMAARLASAVRDVKKAA